MWGLEYDMRLKKTISISIIVVLFVFLPSCGPSETRIQRMIGEAVEHIPKFAQFYEENEEFFELLIDIQNRLREHHYDVGISSFTVSFQLDQYDEIASSRLVINTVAHEPQYGFSQEELQII